MAKVTLGLLQHACGASPAANLRRTLALAEKAARQGANIICTQELFRSQYFCQAEKHEYFRLAEPIPGPSSRAFQALARKHGVVVIASLFERRAACHLSRDRTGQRAAGAMGAGCVDARVFPAHHFA